MSHATTASHGAAGPASAGHASADHGSHAAAHGHEPAPITDGGSGGDQPIKKLLLALVALAFLAWLVRYPTASRPEAAARPAAFVPAAAGGHDAGTHGTGAGHEAGTAQQGDTGHADQSHPSGGHEPAGIFIGLFSHVTPHVWTVLPLGPLRIPLYNIQLFQVLAVVLMFLVFGGVRWMLTSGRPPRGGLGRVLRVFSGAVLFVRDEMVMPILGEHHGKKLFPYFLFVFFFIAFMNLLGLVPHGLTATACVFVTAGLAVTTFGAMLFLGMKEQGVVAYWKHLIPPGLPGPLIPIMVVVELIGLLVKPFALTIRLFANMMAGHLVILSFMGLIFTFAPMLGALTYGVAVPSVGLAVFVMIIEGFVALLQAYIFTYLSILFVGASMHPHH